MTTLIRLLLNHFPPKNLLRVPLCVTFMQTLLEKVAVHNIINFLNLLFDGLSDYIENVFILFILTIFIVDTFFTTGVKISC